MITWILLWLVFGVLAWAIAIKKRLLFWNEPEFKVFTAIIIVAGPILFIVALCSKSGT